MDLVAWRDVYSGGNTLTLSVFLVFLTVLCIRAVSKLKKDTRPLPPGPRGLPIVGNLPFLERDLHRHLADLAKTYGPIFKLRLGTRLCVVLSAPSVAKAAIKKHDIILSDRDVPAVGLASSYGGVDMVWSPYGEHWRMIRRVTVTKLLNNKTLESLYDVRQMEARKLVEIIDSLIGTPIAIQDYVTATLFEMLSGMLWGGSLAGDEKQQLTSEFQKASRNLVELFGETNISDFFPFLGVFDLQRKESKAKNIMIWFDKIFDRIIEQRLEMERQDQYSDFLQVLLQCRDQVDRDCSSAPLTKTDIKAILLDMMVAGTKTSSTTLEWALAELVQQPHLIKKAQKELDEVVGRNNSVEEPHLPKLVYVNAIAKEVLRLHPPAPLLIPRRSTDSCVVGGYMIPKGTKIMFNAWAIQRDPQYWDDPLKFNPERFMSSLGESDGTDFKYMPFGVGRRICVGVPLVERSVPFLLATLLHSFDWKLQEGLMLDMSEAFGLELVMESPLILIPTAR